MEWLPSLVSLKPIFKVLAPKQAIFPSSAGATKIGGTKVLSDLTRNTSVSSAANNTTGTSGKRCRRTLPLKFPWMPRVGTGRQQLDSFWFQVISYTNTEPDKITSGSFTKPVSMQPGCSASAQPPAVGKAMCTLWHTEHCMPSTHCIPDMQQRIFRYRYREAEVGSAKLLLVERDHLKLTSHITQT